MQTNNISQKVIEKIKAGNVKMKPRSLFIFQAISLVFLALVVIVLAVFFTSFTGFALKVKGYSPFLVAVVSGVILFIMLAWVLSKKFSVFYKRPLLLGLAIILMAVAMVSLAVFLTPFHQTIMDYSQQKNVPIISPLYQCGCGCGTSHVCETLQKTPQSSCGCSNDGPAGGSCSIK
ncbi:MAG: hypothetical protein PHE77_03050 [Candidatus Pacebacteria bacterium]|nr:hypothetical protein [Candidatus Paceibacterota bacterium]